MTSCTQSGMQGMTCGKFFASFRAGTTTLTLGTEATGSTIEVYHRLLKQFCGVECCQARSARAQRNHIGWAIRAFLRLEHHRIRTGTSWFETKMGIIRAALQHYLSLPSPILQGLAQSPATA